MTYEADLSLDEATVTVEFDYSAGYAGSYFEPPEPASVELLRVKVGDAWVSTEHFAQFQLERWEEQCLQHVEDTAREARDDMRIQARIDAMEAS